MKNAIYTVGLTGGIGSGKTTLAGMLEKRGAAVYYADPRAKELMNTDPVLMGNIKSLMGERAYDDTGTLDRKYISSRIFSDGALLLRLNAVVHPAVYMDFEHWRMCMCDAPYAVLESAILFESGGDKRCDVTLTVSIPMEERIKRTMERDGATYDAVRARMDAQMSDKDRERMADMVTRAATWEEKEKEADRLDAFFRLKASEK